MDICFVLLILHLHLSSFQFSFELPHKKKITLTHLYYPGKLNRMDVTCTVSMLTLVSVMCGISLLMVGQSCELAEQQKCAFNIIFSLMNFACMFA